VPAVVGASGAPVAGFTVDVAAPAPKKAAPSKHAGFAAGEMSSAA
jgi:hypothetical protein